MTTLSPRTTYRLFGAAYGALFAGVGLARGLAAGQPDVGTVAGVAIGGLGLVGLWRLGERHRADETPDLVIAGGRVSADALTRALKLVPAGIWLAVVLLVATADVHLGPVGTVLVCLLGSVVLWQAAVAVPHVGRWVGVERPTAATPSVRSDGGVDVAAAPIDDVTAASVASVTAAPVDDDVDGPTQ